MKQHIYNFCSEYPYPQSAVNEFIDTYEKISKKYSESFESALSFLFSENTETDKEYVETLETIAEDIGKNRYTVELLFYICACKTLKQLYEKNGISLDIFHDTASDLYYKFNECMQVYNIPGIFTGSWQVGFFKLKRFKLGRMEYELVLFPFKQYKNIKKGDTVINCHIPSSGEPFDKTARQKSYKMAYEFFKDSLPEGKTAFVCSSWLLFPEHKKFLACCKNIIDFMNDFEIIDSSLDKDGNNLWRIFGTASKDINTYKAETSMQKAYLNYLKQGNLCGSGFGVFTYS